MTGQPSIAARSRTIGHPLTRSCEPICRLRTAATEIRTEAAEREIGGCPDARPSGQAKNYYKTLERYRFGHCARSEARHRLANYSSRGPSISPKSLAIQDLSVLNSNPTATRCTRPTHTQRAADSRDGRSMRRQADLDLRAIASTGPSAHHVLDRDGTLLRILVLLWRNDRRFGLSLVSTSSSQARIASQRPSRPQWSDRCRDA